MIHIREDAQSLDVYASNEAVTQGMVVKLSSGKLVKADAGEGIGFALQTHSAISSGTDIFSTDWDGRRNYSRISEIGNIGDRLAVANGPFVADHFDQYIQTVTENDNLYTVGAGLLGTSSASGYVEGSKVVAVALTAGTAGTDRIKIQCKLP